MKTFRNSPHIPLSNVFFYLPDLAKTMLQNVVQWLININREDAGFIILQVFFWNDEQEGTWQRNAGDKIFTEVWKSNRKKGTFDHNKRLLQ